MKRYLVIYIIPDDIAFDGSPISGMQNSVFFNVFDNALGFFEDCLSSFNAICEFYEYDEKNGYVLKIRKGERR